MHTLFALCFVSSISATPLPATTPAVEPSPTPVILTLSFCTPFVVLAALKVSYMRYRRAQSIHAHTAPGPSLAECTETKASRLLGLGFDASVLYTTRRKFGLNVNMAELAGYVTGCLGSPEWETRMRVRVDTTARKCRPPSSFIQSQTASPSVSVRYSSVGSRTTTGGNRTSVSASRFSSSRSRSMSVSFLEMHSPNTNSNADRHSDEGITNCSTVHPSSPPCTDHRHGTMPLPAVPVEASRSNLKSGSVKSRRHASTSTLSPTLMQVMEPVLASWRHESPKDKSSSSGSSNSHDRSPSMTPAFETPPMTPNMPSSPSSSGSVATARLTVSVTCKQISMSSPILERTHSLSASIHHGNVSLPAPTYSPDMSYNQFETKKAPSSITSTSTRSPLSPTSRPLNVQTDMPKYKAMVTPKNVTNFAQTFPSVHNKTSSPIFRNDSWELGDLLKDGKLDFDAVSDVLGLSLSTTSSPVSPALRRGAAQDNSNSSSSSWTGRMRPSDTDTSSASLLVRKCGGPLCAIPEETDDISQEVGELSMHMRRPLSSLVERWGRVCARESVDSSGTGLMRKSVSSSILNVDLSLLGLDVSAINPAVSQEGRVGDSDEGVEIWEEDRSWRENSSVRNSVGLAC